MIETKNCPGTLAPGFNGYSKTCLKRMFDGKRTSHVTDFSYEASSPEFIRAINRISISGVQEKLSAVHEKGKIVLVNEGEHGRYIFKPIPSDRTLKYRQFIPANEHLTMQIARQVFGINTAECAMIFFADGEPAYITRRFDYTEDGGKLAQEDFACLRGGLGDVENAEIVGLVEDGCFHGGYLRMICFIQYNIFTLKSQYHFLLFQDIFYNMDSY